MKIEDYLPIKRHISHCNKFLGQNFLMDLNILKKIAHVVNLENRSTLEIGGGIGNLTIHCLQKNPKTYDIIEKDSYYANYLKNLFPEVNVYNEDCLDYKGKTDVLIGNLPYNIATKFIENIILNNQFNEAVFLIQKEVAERICAKPRSKAYGPLSIVSQILTSPKMLFNVGAQCFTPAPKVTSTVIYLKHSNNLIKPGFLNFIHNAFKHRRKKCYNNLCADQIAPEIYHDLYMSKLENNS